MFSTVFRRPSALPALRVILAIGLVGALSAAPFVLFGCGDDSSSPTPSTTGTVSGAVVEPSSQLPVVGATVTLDPVPGKRATSTLTDSSGDYLFEDVEKGAYTLTVDASGVVVDAGNPDLVYAGFSTQIQVVAGRETKTDIYAPIVDTSEDTDVTPGEPTVLQPESIPGLRIDIPADAVTFPGGGSTGTLNVVELGFNQGPSPLAPGVAPTMMIRILPEGTVFDPPATITFPNLDGAADGYPFEQFSHDGDRWVSDGGATAATEAIDADAGTDIGMASTHYVVCDAHTVTGTVIWGAEVPLEGADVSLWATIKPFGETKQVRLEGLGDTTDAAGAFSIAGVRACRVGFSATYSSAEGSGMLEPSEGTIADASGTTDLGTRYMEIVTDTFFTVVGTVRHADGSPAVGAYINWYDPNSQQNKGVPLVTDGEGHYALEIVYTPGATLRVQAFDEQSGESGDAEFTVPPLAQSGTTITVDFRICSQFDQDPCGQWGTWSLIGSTLRVTLSEEECGEVVTDVMDIMLTGLEDGALGISFEDNGQTVEGVLMRVQGFGPTGISAGNLPGIYAAPDASLIVAIYADGTMNATGGGDGGLTAQWGTYTVDGSTLNVEFLFSNEVGGPQTGDSMSVTWSRSGDTLTIVDPEDTSVFEACANGPDDGSLENLWVAVGRDFTLVFYNGEFAGISPYSGPVKAFR
jgi:hypothetical protein